MLQLLLIMVPETSWPRHVILCVYDGLFTIIKTYSDLSLVCISKYKPKVTDSFDFFAARLDLFSVSVTLLTSPSLAASPLKMYLLHVSRIKWLNMYSVYWVMSNKIKLKCTIRKLVFKRSILYQVSDLIKQWWLRLRLSNVTSWHTAYTITQGPVSNVCLCFNWFFPTWLYWTYSKPTLKKSSLPSNSFHA